MCPRAYPVRDKAFGAGVLRFRYIFVFAFISFIFLYPQLKNDYDLTHKMSIDTRGASAICAVNTRTGFTTVTFCGKARTCKGDGNKDFDRGICQSASSNCYNEKGKTNWAKAMEMAKNVCDYKQGKELPSGVRVYYK